MSEIKYTELDFNLIKENLKNFLKTQDRFKDYNFEGSSLSILLDVLAYNTGYNAFYLNMLASEMFLDSATLRESVVSRAEHLGYVPRSTRTIGAVVNFEIYFDSESAVLPSSLLLSSEQEFFTTINDIRYTFYPDRSQTFTKIGDRRYKIENLKLIEGQRLTHSYTVDTTTPVKQRYVIPNENVDTTTLSVIVRDSASSSNISTYNLATDITEISSTDQVYFLSAYKTNLYEIVFGDDILGKGVVDGNVIEISYVVSGGDGATGANTFRTNKLAGLTVVGNQETTITTISSATGYAEQESDASIKLLAPRSYEAQNRAVTKYDYETLLRRDVSLIEHVRVWGGEENNPPEYGKVFCAIKPKTGDLLNQEDKSRIVNTYLRNKSVLTLDINILDPEYIRVALDVAVNYNSNKTSLDDDSLKNLVLQSIDKYKADYVSGFDSDFRHSKLTSYIDDTDDSIVSNNTDVKIKYRIIPTLNSKNSFSIKLNNEITTGDSANNVASVKSDIFLYNSSRVFLADDGKGSINLYYAAGTSGVNPIIDSGVGTIDYINGTLSISSLLVTSLLNNVNYIEFTFIPKIRDIIALREQMILIEDENINVSMTDISQLVLS